MSLDIYWTALLVLLPTVVLLTGKNLLLRPFQRFTRWEKVNTTEDAETINKDEEASKFRRLFLQVYLLVMGSEWLQGPYLYTLLRDEKALPESTVAALYATVYIAAAVSALGTGFLADRYGRRAACFCFCIIHSVACLTVLSQNLAVLIIGRILAGIALTLLWTVFESWMVTEYISRGFEDSSVPLSSMFGIMTTSNCMAAILGGVLGHCMVLALGSRKDPFVAGITLEAAAAFLMWKTWPENYGVQAPENESLEDAAARKETAPGLQLGDPRIWALSFVGCCFEGTTFLVVFFWPGMLQEAHTNDHGDGDIPYGPAFSTFMAAMILGAWLFRNLTKDHAAFRGQGEVQGWWIVRPSFTTQSLLATSVFVAALSLLGMSLVTSELGTFAMCLLFEVCNGIYVPSIAFQRGLVVDESNRAGVYGLLKIPLFLSVVMSLAITARDTHNRRFILLLSAASLVVACAVSVYCFSYAKVPEEVKEEGVKQDLIEGSIGKKEEVETVDQQAHDR